MLSQTRPCSSKCFTSLQCFLCLAKLVRTRLSVVQDNKIEENENLHALKGALVAFEYSRPAVYPS